MFSVISEEERAHGTVSLKTYYRYFKAGGGFVLTGFVLGIITLTAVSNTRVRRRIKGITGTIMQLCVYNFSVILGISSNY